MKRSVLAATIAMCVGIGVAQTPAAKSSKPLASAELDVPGIVAEVIESTRREGVLTVRVRFRNTGDKAVSFNLASAGYYNDNYITAAGTKYPVARDSKGYVVATPMDPGGDLSARIAKGGTWNWWAKFPAPPDSVKTYALYLKVGPPIEDIPIIDKKPE
ncbi:MAG TPA: hypothetical protein VH744_04135 [Terriglobales bacterium]